MSCASERTWGYPTTSFEPMLRRECPEKPCLLLSDFSAILGCSSPSLLRDGFLYMLSLTGGSEKGRCHSSLSDMTPRHVQICFLLATLRCQEVAKDGRPWRGLGQEVTWCCVRMGCAGRKCMPHFRPSIKEPVLPTARPKVSHPFYRMSGGDSANQEKSEWFPRPHTST